MTTTQKLVAIAHIPYEGNATMAQLAQATSIQLQTVRCVDLQLVQSGWLMLDEKHLKTLVEQIVGHQIESERECYGEARCEADAASELEAILEAAGTGLEESEESMEWLNVCRLATGPGASDEHMLTFDIGNWG